MQKEWNQDGVNISELFDYVRVEIDDVDDEAKGNKGLEILERVGR